MQDHHIEMHEWGLSTLRVIYGDLQNLVVGRPLGNGISRRVYKYVDPVTEKHTDKVIKLEISQHSYFQNVTEWRVWQAVQGTPAEKWFAPCFSISSGGHWLIQAKTRPLHQIDRPKKLPRYLNDLKDANFGIWKGRVVCHDYGIVLSAFASALKGDLKAPGRAWNGTTRLPK